MNGLLYLKFRIRKIWFWNHKRSLGNVYYVNYITV